MKQTSELHYQWHTAAFTHQGNVRTVNEDAFLDRSAEELWIVADGMGGHTDGALASQSIVKTLQTIGKPDELSDWINAIENGLLQVNQQLIAEAQSRETATTIGSTVVALVAWQNIAILMWVGDSRIYRLRNNKLKQLTQDHTQVEEMVQQGLIRAEEAEQHPSSNIITRAIGATHQLYVDIDHREIKPGDCFLLCSDGLNKELTDSQIEDILNSPLDIEQQCLELMNQCLASKGKDNITIILTRAE